MFYFRIFHVQRLQILEAAYGSHNDIKLTNFLQVPQKDQLLYFLRNWAKSPQVPTFCKDAFFHWWEGKNFEMVHRIWREREREREREKASTWRNQSLQDTKFICKVKKIFHKYHWNWIIKLLKKINLREVYVEPINIMKGEGTYNFLSFYREMVLW